MRVLSRLWIHLGEVVFDRGSGGAWFLERSRSTETRWLRLRERVDCFRFSGSYIIIVHYENRKVTWQLTPGQAPLASMLAMAKLCLEHELTPQTGPRGRSFVGLAERGSVQVFKEIPPEPVEYVYLDGARTLEESPESPTVGNDFWAVFDRMAPTRLSTS